jgi:hypothetical protein
MLAVKPVLSSLVALVLVSSAAGCVKPGVCEGVDLVQVQTIDEEADEMRRFRAECGPLSMRIFDASGQAIPFSDEQWTSKVHHIDVSGRGSRLFQHTVLDGKNVLLMMGE